MSGACMLVRVWCVGDAEVVEGVRLNCLGEMFLAWSDL